MSSLRVYPIHIGSEHTRLAVLPAPKAWSRSNYRQNSGQSVSDVHIPDYYPAIHDNLPVNQMIH